MRVYKVHRIAGENRYMISDSDEQSSLPAFEMSTSDPHYL